MSVRDAIATDVVLSPFGADARAIVDAARCVDQSGFDGVWTLDHFSGAMLDRPWSREPFTLLGAMAAATTSVRVGPLVANVVNRHVALLASAASTLQSLAGGRAVLGVGSGASPGSRFAGEHDAIRRPLGGGPARHQLLVETIEALRVLWDGGGTYTGEQVQLAGLTSVVAPGEAMPIIVGASAAQTVRAACHRADGVNIRVTDATTDLVANAQELTAGRAFEISVYDDLRIGHPIGGDVETWIAAGVARRTLVVGPPFDLRALAALGERLNT